MHPRTTQQQIVPSNYHPLFSISSTQKEWKADKDEMWPTAAVQSACKMTKVERIQLIRLRSLNAETILHTFLRQSHTRQR